MDDTTLESLIGAFLDYHFSNFFTCLPATVVGIRDLEQQRIDVQPSINRLFKDGDSSPYPTILSVPIVFPSSSTSALTFPINQGDNVLLVFSQRGLDVFKAGDGSPNDPSDARVFDKRDAIAIPGISPFQKAINKQSNRSLPHSTSDVVLSHNIGTATECEVRMTPDGIIYINGNEVDVGCSTNVDGVLTTTGSVTVGVGATGSFTTPLGQIVTVTDGIITNITG